MKSKRLLFLVMAICFASGVKAQFYDSADDIFYYVEFENGEFTDYCVILNFDGKRAAILNEYHDTGYGGEYKLYGVEEVKKKIKENPNYFEEAVETNNYRLQFVSGTKYCVKTSMLLQNANPMFLPRKDIWKFDYTFSSDRNYLYILNHYYNETSTYKRVEKSFFKVGRSRTPSSTLHE